MSMPPLPLANASDIVRASTKDEEYITLLETSLREIFISSLSNALVSSPVTDRLVGTAARLMYYLSSLRNGIPTTPGEEYSAIIPVRLSAHATQIPSRRLLALLCLAQSVGREDVHDVFRIVWRTFQTGRGRFPSHTLRELLGFIQRVHLAAFYLFGRFYSLPDRLVDVRYLRVAPEPHADVGVSRNGLFVLGVALSVQIGMDFVRTLRRAIGRARRQPRAPTDAGLLGGLMRVVACATEECVASQDDKESEGEDGVGKKCILCLGVMKNATVTSCGHVFCWDCIYGWCLSKEMCPLCRQQVELKKLVCLYNY